MKFRWIELISLLIAGTCFVPGAQATTLDSYLRNRDGMSKFQAKSYYPAYQDFMKALDDDPLNPEIHLNIARTLEANEEFDKAEKAYRGVLQLLPGNSTRRFEALFNLAGVQAKLKKIPEALDTYQRALEMDPDSIEVKTNIELLWQQGQGEGDGDQGQGQKDDKDQKGRGEKEKDDQKDKPDQKNQKKNKPKPFESKQLSAEDVKKILDEIKNQEQSIRADENDKNVKQAQPEKDW